MLSRAADNFIQCKITLVQEHDIHNVFDLPVNQKYIEPTLSNLDDLTRKLMAIVLQPMLYQPRTLNIINQCEPNAFRILDSKKKCD